jgi:hypothetical protein
MIPCVAETYPRRGFFIRFFPVMVYGLGVFLRLWCKMDLTTFYLGSESRLDVDLNVFACKDLPQNHPAKILKKLRSRARCRKIDPPSEGLKQ